METLVRFVAQPRLRAPYMIACPPGIGGVGESVARYLIQMLDAELFAELISPRLPDYVTVRDGICYLPTYSFYAVGDVEPGLIVVTGEAGPRQDDIVGHYELSEEVVKVARRLGVGAIISVGGVAMSGLPEGVFVAYPPRAEGLARRFLEAGAKLMPKTRIVGAAGLIPAMAAEANIDSVCLLSTVSSLVSDRDASLRLLKVLLKGLGLSLRPAS